MSRRATVLCWVRGTWGLALLTAPDPLASAIGGVSCDPPMRAIIRVLGAREAAQALVTRLRPQRTVMIAGAAVDATHSASMVLLAARKPRLRRLAAASAAAAGVFAAVGATSLKPFARAPSQRSHWPPAWSPGAAWRFASRTCSC